MVIYGKKILASATKILAAEGVHIMTQSEYLFKKVVGELVSEGVYPSPMAILRVLPPYRMGSHNLSGRQCKWRAEVLTKLGWKHSSLRKRARSWAPPPGWQEVG